MAPDIVSLRNRRQPLRPWPWRLSLTWRILAVNAIALALVAGGFLYIDRYRTRQIDAQLHQSAHAVEMIGVAITAAGITSNPPRIAEFGRLTDARLRVYDPRGGLKFDSRTQFGPAGTPEPERLNGRLARIVDQVIDTVVGAPRLAYYTEPAVDQAAAWPELRSMRRDDAPRARAMFAPNRSLMISAGTRLADGRYLLAIWDARSITRDIRTERFYLAMVLGGAILACTVFSIFLGRTIVHPLRQLARSAIRVRLGRAREVVVPRLPDRRDEIGLLARALSDMTHALRQRIDATDAFAADVSHELKNPIASLRSALEGLARVDRPDLRAQLMTIAMEDVARLDRLVTDIADASRIDAELSRADFESVDLLALVRSVVRMRDTRGTERNVRLEVVADKSRRLRILGNAQRLETMLDNLVDNAISFSPPGAVVHIILARAGDGVTIRVEDEGPGIPPDERDAVFTRFHSVRPAGEQFGRHSGLGLAIARSIVEGHHGAISVADRADGRPGACIELVLPRARHDENED